MMFHNKIGALIGLTLALASCGDPSQTEVVGTPLRAPPFDDRFKIVADALTPTCGTLDCHAQAGRNLRFRGLSDEINAGGDLGRDPYLPTYWSIVGLEPEVLDAVVRDRGADPERLVLVRKARRAEKHEGGALMIPGDDLDRCLVSWLAGKVDTERCACNCDSAEPCGGPCSIVICDLQCRRRRVQIP